MAVKTNKKKIVVAGKITVDLSNNKKFTSDKLEIAIARARKGGSDELIALDAGISLWTWRKFLSDNEDVADYVNLLRKYPRLQAEDTIINGLDDVSNSQWYLEHNKESREDWSGKPQQETNISLNIDNKPLKERINSLISEYQKIDTNKE